MSLVAEAKSAMKMQQKDLRRDAQDLVFKGALVVDLGWTRRVVAWVRAATLSPALLSSARLLVPVLLRDACNLCSAPHAFQCPLSHSTRPALTFGSTATAPWARRTRVWSLRIRLCWSAACASALICL